MTVKNKAAAAEQQILLHTLVWSLSLSLLSPTLFILRVPLDLAEAGPRQVAPEQGPEGKPRIVQFSERLRPH